jgi:7-carboxy-7-deazaguanine synthase
MVELKLVEHYTSIQGEGPRTGVMTQFVRFAGCNMRCPLWPCDTQHAIQPSIYGKPNGSYKRTPEELVGDIIEMARTTGARNICLTGGEPFQQPQEKMIKLIKLVPESMNLECFSNGSFLYPAIALKRIHFIMDWKLDGSGEGQTALGNRLDNALGLKSTDAIKFVVTDENDLEQAKDVWNKLMGAMQNTDKPLFYVGAAWDRITVPEIQDFITKHQLPWLVNVQIHKYIWHPEMRGV